jgi:predicted nucleic-acid-binding protein
VRAIDTNVLVRLVARDDAAHAAKAEAFVAGGAWVSTVVLAETTWTLASVYGVKAPAIAVVVAGLLENANLALQDADAVTTALERFKRRPALGFSDCLVLEVARNAGHLPLGTFDRPLGKLDGAKAL